MGGCITPVVKKQQKITKPDPGPKKPSKQEPPSVLDTTNPNINAKPDFNKPPQKPKNKKMTGEQFTRLYRVEDNVGTTVRMEGPKYVSNYADGIGKVLRVVPFGAQGSLANSSKDVDIEARVKIYAEVLGLQLYEDEESNLLVFQEYYCGPYIHEISSQENQEQVRRFLSEAHQLIESFHQRGVILGNLSITSFRQTSEYDSTVRLVELNLLASYDQAMGHAFRAEKSMDWEAFAFIVATVSLPQPPIFIPHKIQYLETGNATINTLLKGKKIKREELDNIKYNVANPNIVTGYKFRADLERLLKLRKRRHHHRDLYYGEDAITNGQKNPDESLQRLQTSRIFQRIELYMKDVNPQCEEPFTMHSAYNESLKKLRAVFSVPEAQKKMEEFKQTLPLIK